MENQVKCCTSFVSECENSIRGCQEYVFAAEEDKAVCEDDLFCDKFPDNHRCVGYVSGTNHVTRYAYKLW